MGRVISITTVVHVNSEDWTKTPAADRVYIGRASRWKGFKASKWANPYKVGRDGTREEVIGFYAYQLRLNPERAREARQELQGKVLGCWCHPEHCHGDVLAWLADCPEPEFEHWLATGEMVAVAA